MAKRILTSLHLGKIAAVDRPCQAHATMAIMKAAPPEDLEADAGADEYMKRQFTADQRKDMAAVGTALPDGSFPISNKADLKNAIRAVGRASNKAAAKKHIIQRAKKLGATDMLPTDWSTSKSIGQIISDFLKGEVPLSQDPDGDIKMFDETMAQSGIQTDLWDANSALNTSICSILNDTDATDKAALLSNTLDEFKSHIQDLVSGAISKSTGAPHEVEGAPMSSDALKKSLGLEPTATEADVEKAAAALVAKAAKAEVDAAIANMSDKHKQYAKDKGMGDDAMATFAGKTPTERDAHMENNPIEKAAVDPVIAKLHNDNAEMAKKLDVLQKSADIAEITKRIDPDGKYAGDASADALLIYDLGKSDPKAATALETRLTTLAKQVAEGGLLGEVGSSQRGIAKGAQAIQSKALELQKADPKLSIQKARVEARKLNPDLAKQEADEAAAERSNARDTRRAA